MLAGGAALLEASHMYRSSLTLAFVVLCSAAAAASDLSSVYVAPGGIYAPSADVYVRPGPTDRQPPYAEAASARALPCAGAMRRRLRQVDLLRLNRRLRGSLLHSAQDGWSKSPARK